MPSGSTRQTTKKADFTAKGKITPLSGAATGSADVVGDNLGRLRALFPELITEDQHGVAVNVDILKQLVGDHTVTEAEEKYGLNWHGKWRARQLALTPSTGTLRPVPEDSVDWDTTQNLMIEGDNLEVLKLLQKSYAGKVKLIYIDPPYNTGKDFVYPDNFQDNIKNYLELTGQVEGGNKISSNTEASGRFHTDWLNMMYPRIKLARNFLRADGILCVSIDSHEIAQLSIMLDEIFGAENRIGHISVVNNLKGRSDDAFLATSHETLVVCARDIAVAELSGLPLPPRMVQEYELEDEISKYKLIPLKKSGKNSRREDRPNMYYPIYVSADLKQIGLKPFQGAQEIVPSHGGGDGRWRWGKETFGDRAERDVVVRAVRGGGLTVFSKMRLGQDGEERTLKAKTTWIDPKFDSGAGNRDLAALQLGDAFQNPKPVAFLRDIVTIGTEDGGVVMDFFAGSGTTGHAVLAQNATDGGSRRYVLVQLPETLDPADVDQRTTATRCDKLGKPRTIAELTKERLRQAGKKIKNDNPLFAGDVGFRAFKLDSTNIRAWEPNRLDLPKTIEDAVEHVKRDRTDEDVLFELLLKLGLDLTVAIEKKTIAGKDVHSIGSGVLFACLAAKITAEDVDSLALGIADWRSAQNPAGESTIVFRDSAFANDVTKTNLAAILEQHGFDEKNVRSL